MIAPYRYDNYLQDLRDPARTNALNSGGVFDRQGNIINPNGGGQNIIWQPSHLRKR